MIKGLKITLNLVIFVLIISFVWYIVASVNQNSATVAGNAGEADNLFQSPCTLVSSFELSEEINRFDLYENRLFIQTEQSLYVYDTEGNPLNSFTVEPNVRDVAAIEKDIYLLYPAQIKVYSMEGVLIRHWEACSKQSDYCSIAVAKDAVFVTDAGDKNVCKYTIEGDLVKFLRSPLGFVIPSYAFDIDCFDNTVYCVNSGRHLIETYSINGNFIGTLGKAGSEAGSFAGCCNPAYISFTPEGTLLTSEKGNPRISSFDRDGKFKNILLNSEMLGSGNKACEVKATDDKLYVAAKKKILIYFRLAI